MSRRQRNFAIATIVASAILAGGWFFTHRGGPVPETEIYRGVTYQCLEFPRAAEVRGLAHIVTADLSTPGVSLYVTPLDPAAAARGWEYRLDYVSRVVAREHLAAAINGGYFAADSRFTDSAGDFAVSTEVNVAEHQPSHVSPNSYMLWLDDDAAPHLEYHKPPPADSLRRAKWAMSAQMVILINGVVSEWAPHTCDKRTAIGFNSATKKLYLVVFEYASPTFVAETLLHVGATDAIILDGGGSTTMALGAAARGSSGTMLGGWRPVATMIGVHAEPLK